jgi:hypothetical protein
MKLYRFSPIKTEDALQKAVSYLIGQETVLAANLIGSALPITFLTVFAHYDDEYDTLSDIIRGWGEMGKANNGVKVRLSKAIRERGQSIEELRIRQPDPYRMQVGCCDFGVDDYSAFKETNLGKRGLRLIERPKYEMIEFFDPDFDVLAYIVSA